MTLFLVRHGRPLVDRSRPPHEWSLDPAYDDDVRALRSRLPGSAVWYSSSEPKAFMTARLLTEEPIEIVPDLREHERHTSDWIEDFEAVVHRAFAEPDLAAYDGWEPLGRCRDRVVRVAAGILATHRGADVVLVGRDRVDTSAGGTVRRGARPDMVVQAGDAGRLSMRGPAPPR